MKATKILGTSLLGLCLAVVPSAAQEYGSLHGKAVDSTGSPLPGVTVTLGGVGVDRVAVTDAEGAYRFLGLDPGTYGLIAELDGFSTVEQPNVVIGLNRSTQIVVQLSAAVEETITVTSESPLLDERKLSQGTNLSKVELEKIPSARDPWSVLSQAPGVITDRSNVGGNESGQQASFVSPGLTRYENEFQVDGVQITDMSATGGSPTYYDFDQFEAIELSTGGTDVTKTVSGASVNLVTKRGTNEFRGSARLLMANDTFFGGFLEQGETTLSRSELGPNQETFSSRKVDRVVEYGVEAGGPVVQDRLWAWGSFGVNDIEQVNFGGGDDDTLLENTSLKLNAQLSSGNSAVGSWNVGDKKKFGRGASTTRPREASWNQRGPTDIYKVEDTHVFGSSFYLTGQYSEVDGGFSLAAIGGSDVSPYQDATGVWRNTYYGGTSVRPSEELRVDGSYFFNTGNVSHELKFGGRDRQFASTSLFTWPGLVRSRESSNVGLPDGDNQVDFYRIGGRPHELNYTSLWVQDTLASGNWTINAGFRLDQQDGVNAQESLPASVYCDSVSSGEAAPCDLLGPTSGRVVPGFEWEDVLPRLGVTYGLGEERKTLLRASFAQFPEQLETEDITLLSTSTSTTASYIYRELGGPVPGYTPGVDRLVRLLNFSGGGGDEIANRIDPDLTAPLTSELILGAEHAFLPEFVVGASLTWRETEDILEQRDLFRTADGREISPGRNEHIQTGSVTATLPDGEVVTAPVFSVNPALGLTSTGGVLLTNGVRSVEYQGVTVNFTKRLANQWMLRGYVNFGDAEWNVPDSFFNDNEPNIQTTDPNFRNDKQRGDVDGEIFFTEGSRDNAFLQSGWQWNLTGMYQFAPDRPWGFNVSANLYGREGYPIPYFSDQTTADGNTREISLAASDRFRTDDLFTTDFRLEKEFATSGNVNFTVGLDVFNVFDESTVLVREAELTAGNGDEVQDVLAPRVYKIGVRVAWR